MKFRPLHDRVLVRRMDEDTKTSGGIIIPDSAQEKPSRGEIIAAGPGARDANGVLVALDVQPGATLVVFGVGAVGLAAGRRQAGGRRRHDPPRVHRTERREPP